MEKAAGGELRLLLFAGPQSSRGVIASASEAIHGAVKRAWIASSLSLLAMTA
jgi:hypothetical protein